MIKRSCEHKTNIPNAVAKRIAPMVEGAMLKHNNGTVNWWVGNYSNDIEKFEQIVCFKDLFRHYEFENYPLRYNSVKVESEAQIKIYFVAPDNMVYLSNNEKFECPFKFDKETLAAAYSPYGGKWQGYVFINDGLFWTLRKDEKGKHDLFSTLLHELGHVFNLDHSSNKKDLMYYMEEDGQEWGNDSIQLLYNIYKDERLKYIPKSGFLLMEDYRSNCKTVSKRMEEMFTEKDLPISTITLGVVLILSIIVFAIAYCIFK